MFIEVRYISLCVQGFLFNYTVPEFGLYQTEAQYTNYARLDGGLVIRFG